MRKRSANNSFFSGSDGITASTSCCDSKRVKNLEHVEVEINYQTDKYIEKTVDITLCSPGNTCSVILHHNCDNAIESLKSVTVQRSWRFSSVHFWDESPIGTWTITVTSKEDDDTALNTKFKVKRGCLILHGTGESSDNNEDEASCDTETAIPGGDSETLSYKLSYCFTFVFWTLWTSGFFL